ncbi:MAG: hypothetical protein ACI9ON_002152 [Limisphaerales bacterium]
MRDGINLARLGIPSVALVTEKFWPQGEFVAQSLGMPTAPKVQLPHPIAGTGNARVQAIANEMVAGIVARLAA